MVPPKSEAATVFLKFLACSRIRSAFPSGSSVRVHEHGSRLRESGSPGHSLQQLSGTVGTAFPLQHVPNHRSIPASSQRPSSHTMSPTIPRQTRCSPCCTKLAAVAPLWTILTGGFLTKSDPGKRIITAASPGCPDCRIPKTMSGVGANTPPSSVMNTGIRIATGYRTTGNAHTAFPPPVRRTPVI